MEGTLRVGISGDPVVCDLLVGMVLGVTSSIPDILLQEFRGTGTYHLFSVSGLHVGMIGVILWQALKTAGVGRRWAVAIIIPALFFYALLTGWKPSSLRAAMMSAIFLIGMTSSRRPAPFNSLCAAAFLILVQWTNELFNPGFQLSFLVVAAILLFAVPLHDLIRRRWHPDPFVPRQIWTKWQKRSAETVEKIGGLAAVSLAAWVGSLPLTLYYFQMISLSALPANLAIVPLAFVIMVTAVLALAGGIFWSTLAAIFNNANWVFCKVLLGVVHVMSGLPGSFVYIGTPAPAPLTVTVFDLGAGGSAGIRSDGKVWLLDCGAKWQSESVILPWLRNCGKAGPDGLLLTHGDAHHIGGALGLMETCRPGILVDSVLDDRSPQRGLLHKKLQELASPKSLARAGDTFRISKNAVLKILYPPAGTTRDIADDKALVVRLDSGTTRLLFLSDAGPYTMDWLLKNAAPELPADILVKGAHRSGLPVDDSFIDAVRPRMIVATAAAFPASERPDGNWVSRMESRGIRVFRQDLSGAVTIRVQASDFQAAGFFDGSTFTPPTD
jgi:ComEC/Rec2-related protein